MHPPPLHWRKSSHSDHHGGDCVEVADLTAATTNPAWRKSSRSDQFGGDCVEVADLTPLIAVRDSKDPDGPRLTFSAAAWSTFTRRIKASAHDLA